MKIVHIDIQNFRKLKTCRVEFAKEKTVFVGANNSGKTSAMDALILFLKKSKNKDLKITDFTLSNWSKINDFAQKWISSDNPDLPLDFWQKLVPVLDLWLDVTDAEVHYVSHIIPTLDWQGGKLGIRLIFEPKDIKSLYKSFSAAYNAAQETNKGRNAKLKLWPKDMRDFLERELHKYFKIKAYILDPSKSDDKTPQSLFENAEPIEGDPFKGLFKIDIINAQRGFTDPNSEEISNSDRRLSVQLRRYFENHLNPSELPDANDLDALEAIETAQNEFNKKLKESFQASIGELEGLNYPGFSDPEIIISSEVNPLEGLKHDAAVQFNVRKDGSDSSDISLCLPEKYNGLGYQNLISMIFSLIRFRDEWMRVGKAGKRTENNSEVEPLHIVLIEEPEAHLHAQVQQVFIKKSYNVLRNHPDLKNNDMFSTQLIISTHSSHIAHEIDFASLRYFKRKPATKAENIPTAEVVNLSTTFGDSSGTAKFATRYLKTTHCDLFFADATIMVEGPAERMLIPHFIKNKFSDLNRSYISLLEIGGSHAHRLKPLIETLGLLTLVITDLDSVAENSTNKVLPQKAKNYRTGNSTIKSWIPQIESLDEVLNATNKEKVQDNFIRVAYQNELNINYFGNETTVIPYTFEDALVLSNIELFKQKTSSTGLLKKMADAVNEPSISNSCTKMFEALGKNSKKAEMALELLFTTEPNKLNIPNYIEEGLEWLQKQLENNCKDYLTSTANSGGK